MVLAGARQPVPVALSWATTAEGARLPTLALTVECQRILTAARPVR